MGLMANEGLSKGIPGPIHALHRRVKYIPPLGKAIKTTSREGEGSDSLEFLGRVALHGSAVQ